METMEFQFILPTPIVEVSQFSYAEMGHIKIIGSTSEFTSRLTYVIFDAMDMMYAFNKFITNKKEKWWTYDTSAQGKFHLKIERHKNNQIAVFLDLKVFDIVSIQDFYEGFRMGVENLEDKVNSNMIPDKDREIWEDFFKECRILKNIDIGKYL
jgi:hypothetical protein